MLCLVWEAVTSCGRAKRIMSRPVWRRHGAQENHVCRKQRVISTEHVHNRCIAEAGIERAALRALHLRHIITGVRRREIFCQKSAFKTNYQ